MRLRTEILTLLLISCVVACTANDGPPLAVSAIELTQPMPGRSMSAGYLTLTNNSAEAISINKVTSNGYRSIELHETTVTDGVARMRPVEALHIAARSSISLQRGGLHLMLMGQRDINEEITLNFYDGDTLLLTVTAGSD